MFDVGEIVEHKLHFEWLFVVEKDGDNYICRTKTFDLIEFKEFELQKKLKRK